MVYFLVCFGVCEAACGARYAGATPTWRAKGKKGGLLRANMRQVEKRFYSRNLFGDGAQSDISGKNAAWRSVWCKEMRESAPPVWKVR